MGTAAETRRGCCISPRNRHSPQTVEAKGRSSSRLEPVDVEDDRHPSGRQAIDFSIHGADYARPMISAATVRLNSSLIREGIEVSVGPRPAP